VWLSEVMLQQTTVAAVKPYFEKFTDRWPNIVALAEAGEDEVMAAWAGLGYYSRARNLVKCASEVAAMGAFPETEEGLRQLPGIGPYTAAAIAAIAFGKRAVVVDANVERVAARLFAISDPLPGSRTKIWDCVDQVTPDERAGDFAQAMMDLGATICIAREPRCSLCPVSDFCEGYRSGEAAILPMKAKKKPRPERKGQAYWIEREGAVWLVNRPATGMLGGMRALPDDGWSAQGDGSGIAPMAGDWHHLGVVRHVFTHATLTLNVMRYSGSELPDGEGQWWPLAEMDEAGLPTLFQKAVRLALA
jgi:A/G-specific adenine glycosylase